MSWVQVYDPLHAAWLSTLVAAIPIVVLLTALALLEWRPYWAAAAGLGVALVVATGAYGMPVESALASAAYGAIYGVLPIGWIVLAAAFLYNLTVKAGQFDILRASVARLSDDPRVQVVLIAFSFGAFLEGAAGFGAPVAVTAALLIGLGFRPLHAAGLSLIANTAPVAFGAIGTPILTLANITGIPAMSISMMAGRQLPFMSLLIPAWLVVTMSGWKGLRGVWPAVAVSGVSFAVIQFAWSNFVGPELVDIVGGLVSLGALAVFCRFWSPSDRPAGLIGSASSAPTGEAALPAGVPLTTRARVISLVPWIILSLFVMVWGLPSAKAALNGGTSAAVRHVVAPVFEVPGLHQRVFREYPVERTPADAARIDDPAYRAERGEAARYTFNWLSASGTAILFTALLTAALLRMRLRAVGEVAWATLKQMRASMLTISLMMAVGYVSRYSGTDATLGLAFTKTGVAYPMFAALLGWLGVALTGSDTSSNVLFGSLQKVTAEQLGLNPLLIVTANSTGGVMGKMIDAQSIVVATSATRQIGQEGRILRFVFFHSVVLALLMGLIVLAQAYWLSWMVPQ